MKKILFFLFVIAFVSCNPQGLIDGLSVHVAMPQVNISTPAVPQGTWTINREVSVDSLNAIVKTATGKNLDEVTDIVLSGVTVSIVTPDSLTFSKFSYGKLIVSSQTSSVTVFDRQLSETGRTHVETNLNSNIKNVIQQARNGNKILTYSLTVTTTSIVPSATWKIVSNVAVTP